MDEVTIRARETLLDALDALHGHLESVVIVGAQAIYLRTDSSLVATAPFTRDADLCLLPSSLKPAPPIQACLRDAGFEPGSQPGSWKRVARGFDPLVAPMDAVDLLVPSVFAAGPGRRSVLLGGEHSERVARRTDGLAACASERGMLRIESLRVGSRSAHDVSVAGTGAMLIAKLYKLGERAENTRQPDRLRDKDALDVLRLLRHERSLPRSDLADRLARLRGESVTRQEASNALAWLEGLFGTSRSDGAVMAARALAGVEDEGIVRESCAVLARDLLAAIREGR